MSVTFKKYTGVGSLYDDLTTFKVFELIYYIIILVFLKLYVIIIYTLYKI